MGADMLGGAAARPTALVRALWGRAVRDDSVSARIRRGQEIAGRGGQIKAEAPNRYAVRSQSKDSKTYTAEYLPRGWSCGCPDHQNRKRNCKHIYAVIQRNTDAMRGKAGMDAPKAHAKEPPGEGDGASGSAAAAREEIIGRLAARYPERDIPGMPGMPFEDGVLAIRRTPDGLDAADASNKKVANIRRHVAALLALLLDRDPGAGARASCWRRPARGATGAPGATPAGTASGEAGIPGRAASSGTCASAAAPSRSTPGFWGGATPTGS